MIIGSGLLARAFAPYFETSATACVYAAGISNSACSDQREFERELIRLTAALDLYRSADLFLYFGTCSVSDPLALSSSYVQHKIKMEQIVTTHSRHLILRLPQVAGNTPNPHTLLNFIFQRISRSERFSVWENARRNLIDIDHVARIGASLALEDGVRNECINVANFSDIAMPDLVELMGQVVGKKVLCDYVSRGEPYQIDTRRIHAVVQRCGVCFDSDYVERIIGKYYGPASTA
ncbi:MAG: hypothetical protein A3G87_05375 [Omnitrophica bacterium RIFCSPLOWO2_12_FULL_50_11]|nr:MAG: hypothetical protein A3G87_05375 [Omnitrophica bacterium RIFCSPLOWO2_12_FULL_50_11]